MDFIEWIWINFSRKQISTFGWLVKQEALMEMEIEPAAQLRLLGEMQIGFRGAAQRVLNKFLCCIVVWITDRKLSAGFPWNYVDKFEIFRHYV